VGLVVNLEQSLDKFQVL